MFLNRFSSSTKHVLMCICSVRARGCVCVCLCVCVCVCVCVYLHACVCVWCAYVNVCTHCICICIVVCTITWCVSAAQDGRIDWNTLGNTLTAALLGEVPNISVLYDILINEHFKQVLQVSYLDAKHAAKKGKEAILTDWW